MTDDACSGEKRKTSVCICSLADGYNQTTLNFVSFFKDIGGNLGIISGLIYEIAPPWIVLSIGAFLNLFGYLMIWLASFPNTGALVTCVRNYPETRGSVIGLLKGFIGGLSGAIMTQIYQYHGLYGDDSKSVILLIAWLPAAVPMIFLPVIRIINSLPKSQDSRVLQNGISIGRIEEEEEEEEEERLINMSKKGGGGVLVKEAPWRVQTAKPIPKIHHSPLMRVSNNTPLFNYAQFVIQHPNPVGHGLATEAIVEAAGPDCIVPGQVKPLRLLGLKVWPIEVDLTFMEPVGRELKLLGKFMDNAVDLMNKSFIDR
ncbi:hypothetical protein ACFE04_002075 [Oxalis oulophora]